MRSVGEVMAIGRTFKESLQKAVLALEADECGFTEVIFNEALLAEPRLRNEGYFNPSPIRQRWLQHASGRFNWRDPLWVILMFQAWLNDQQSWNDDIL